MASFALLSEIQRLPNAFDGGQAAVLRERLLEAAREQGGTGLEFALKDLAKQRAGAGLLDAILGNSPFLGHAVIADPQHFLSLAERGAEQSLAAILSASVAADSGDTDLERLKRTLRQLRLRAAVTIAVGDVGNVWDLPKITRALSDFADAAIAAAVRTLLRRAGLAGSDPGVNSGYIVFALGKLGGRELNYSSDVDPVILWDSEKAPAWGDAAEERFVRVTQDLLGVLQDRTADGYVFRVDLRLRPDANATPVAVSLPAAEAYYESVGASWERAAWIKGRAIAGDIAAGEAFLKRLTPFLWRKNLDFAAIADIHAMKSRIHAHYGHGEIRVRGHNVKVGRGGIREIEFFAQAQQLVAGGRDPRLRVPDTCGALAALAASGVITAAVAGELTTAYRTLRTAEHRIQMIGDEQTHTIPEDDPGFKRFATFLGYDEPERLEVELRGQMELVARHYDRLFEQTAAADANRPAFTGSAQAVDGFTALRSAGFQNPSAVADVIATWLQGRYRATRSPRARALLGDLLPAIVGAFGGTAYPDAALLSFDTMLAALPAGVQLFSLFQAHPELLALVAEVMGTAPRLAQALSTRPGVLDVVLQPAFLDPLPPPEALTADLEAALTGSAFEEALDRTRRWVAERHFQIGVQMLRGRADVTAAGRMNSDVAEAAIGILLRRVSAEFAKSHGLVAESAFAVIALGKLGAREMTASSDLDLLLIYDCPGIDVPSDGPRRLPAAQYFARLAQRLVSAISAPTAEGRLYEVDTRLRPSGSKGTAATLLETFLRYQRDQAWTLERMAMTRARFVAGDAALGARTTDGIRATLASRIDPGAFRNDVAWLRARVAQEHPSADPWNVKYVRGGLMDAEMLCQYLQVRAAGTQPEVVNPDTAAACRALATAGQVAPAVANDLVPATVLLRTVQMFLRQCSAAAFDATTAPDGVRAAIARFAGFVDFAALQSALVEAERRVYLRFQEHVPDPRSATPTE